LRLPEYGNKEVECPKEEVPQEEGQPVSPLPPDAEALLEAAMEEYLAKLRAQETPRALMVKSWEDSIAAMRKCVPGPPALRRRAREYVRTWFTVDTKNEYPDVTLTPHAVYGMVEDAHQKLLWDLMEMPKGQEFDGAWVHSIYIRSTVETREKKRFDDAMQRLTDLANTPISFEPSTGDVDELVTPQAAYAEFTGQLRAQGLDETSVFDLVAQLSKLIKQSQEILPSVTQAVVRQLEARVLLSYYKQLQTEQAEKAEQAKQKQLAEASLAQTADISAQLSSLNAVAERQAKDTSTNTFLHLLDGLFGH
jgi:hypothetical protein